MTELAKQINADLYPEISAAGSLSNALGQALADIGSPLQCASEMNFIPLARVEGGSRFCQMYIAAHERLFIFDFWTKGVGYGNGSCSDLNDAAQAIHFWITEEPNIAAMQDRFTLFTPTEQARSHEAGEAVDYQWEKLSARWAKYGADFAHSPLPLIEAASKRPELRQLFPFTSMSSLHFSRTTGYPFTNDCPWAIPIGDGRYRAHQAGGSDVIGEGDAEEVIAMLVANLPPDCGPAVEGTAEDLV
jgi:hypothetical protein